MKVAVLARRNARCGCAAFYLSAGAALIVAALAVAFAFDESVGSPSAPAPVPAGLPGELVGTAPWPANNGSQLGARLAALKLPALAFEGTALHIHQHLDSSSAEGA